jgi:glycosyltransferase involved in cell wall biosynthesis
MSNRRFLFVIHYPVFGGPHNQALRLAEPLAERGWETVVLLPDEPGNATTRLQEAGVRVITAPLGRIRALPSPRVQMRTAARFRPDVQAIRRALADEGADLVVLGGLANAQAAFAGRAERVPVVWQLLDTRMPAVLSALYLPLLAEYADSIMVTGHRVARAHPGVPLLSSRTVPFFPPVDRDLFAPSAATREASRSELGLHGDGPVIGIVGNLSPMKGHGTFLQVAAEVQRLHPDARFLILGADFEYRADYSRALWAQAERLGLSLGETLIVRDPADRIPELAQALDVVVLTSEPRSEGLPTVIGEMMALGKPVVAADVGGVSEAVEDGVDGFVVPTRDIAAFTTAIARLLEDPELFARMSSAAIEGATRYSIERSADAHVEAFTLAQSRSSRPSRPPSAGAARPGRAPLRVSLERRIGHGRYGSVVGAGAGVWSFLEYNLSPAGRRSARRIQEFRDTYKGQRCFIIGNGPSLRRMDLSPLRDEVTFGLNRIYLLFEELGFSTTFLASINRLVLEQAAHELTAVDSTVMLNWWSRHHVPPGRDPIYLRVTSARPRFSKRADRGIWAGATVTFAALQLAYYMGFDEAILIGIDHSFAETGPPNAVVESSGPDQNHFSPNYFGKGFRWQLPDLAMSERAYELARAAYERAGRRVVDATVDGKLEVFPKVEFTSLFDPKDGG